MRARRAGGGGGWQGPGCRCGEHTAGPAFTRRERVATLIDDPARVVDQLARADPELVHGEAERALRWRLGVSWDHGWQPAEVLHHTTRTEARAGRVAAVAVAADTSRRDPATLHPRWAAQVHSFALPDGSGTSGWLTAFAVDERGVLLPVLAARDDVVDDAVTEMFGELRPDLVRGGADAAGWAAGSLPTWPSSTSPIWTPPTTASKRSSLRSPS